MKQTFINMLEAGQTVDDIFVAQNKQLAQKKNGEPYLIMTLADRTGGLKAVVWDNVEDISSRFATGDYVHVKGNVGQYRENLQVVVRNLEPVSSERVEPKDFLPVTERDAEQMFKQLVEAAETIKNADLSALLQAFFQDAAFVERFKTAPAAKKMHHAYVGGLLEHTLSITLLVDAVAAHYKGINRDLLLAGAILHDIGKVHELRFDTHIDYSDSGRLLNHIVIGIEMLDEKIATLGDFPQESALLLKHLIVSHHGTREFGSPEPPKTLEAIILNYIDDLDAKVTGVRAFMQTHDDQTGWTSYHRLMERFFYKGIGGDTE